MITTLLYRFKPLFLINLIVNLNVKRLSEWRSGALATVTKGVAFRLSREERDGISGKIWRRQTESKGPDFIDQDQNETGEMKEEDQDPGFTDPDPFKREIKEEDQDPDYMEQDYFNIRIKEESQDPDFIGQDQYGSGIKEENLDPDFSDQDQFNSGIKQEDQDSEYMDHDRYKEGIKEEELDPDFLDQESEIKEEIEYSDQNPYSSGLNDPDPDPDQQSTDPAGSTDHQVSVDDVLGLDQIWKNNIYDNVINNMVKYIFL